LILTEDWIQEFGFDFSRTHGVHKYKSVDAFYYEDQNSVQKKITFGDNSPKIEDIEDWEWEFFKS
jgi:hypothetical protein